MVYFINKAYLSKKFIKLVLFLILGLESDLINLPAFFGFYKPLIEEKNFSPKKRVRLYSLIKN